MFLLEKYLFFAYYSYSLFVFPEPKDPEFISKAWDIFQQYKAYKDFLPADDLKGRFLAFTIKMQ